MNDYNVLAKFLTDKYIDRVSGRDFPERIVGEDPEKVVMAGTMAEDRNEETFEGGYREDIQIVRHMIDNRLHYSNRGIPVLCPMYLYEDGKAKPNVNSEMVSMITEKTGISFSESLVESETEFDIMDLFDYSYGILNSPLYIEKYIDLLKIEFPKVPIPNGNEMFWRIVAYGRRLRKLHLLEEDIGNPMGISFEGVGDNIVSSRKLKPEGLYINRTQLFTNVTEEIWDFCYGGYHGLQKWFKDRNGMKLSEDDIQHVIRVLNVFEKTISIREDLDICMDEFGLI